MSIPPASRPFSPSSYRYPGEHLILAFTLGLVLVVSEFYAESIRSQLADCGVESFAIGAIEPGERGVFWAS